MWKTKQRKLDGGWVAGSRRTLLPTTFVLRTHEEISHADYRSVPIVAVTQTQAMSAANGSAASSSTIGTAAPLTHSTTIRLPCWYTPLHTPTAGQVSSYCICRLAAGASALLIAHSLNTPLRLHTATCPAAINRTHYSLHPRSAVLHNGTVRSYVPRLIRSAQWSHSPLSCICC